MKNKKALTLVEIIIGVLFLSLLIIGGFQALTAIQIGKARLVNDVDIQKQTVFFLEKFAFMIKQGGSIDYEEYFNRKIYSLDLTDLGDHFKKRSGFGNFGSGGVVGTTTYGSGYYYCISFSGASMGTGGCANNSYNTFSGATTGKHQRYGQYELQFIDYNSDANRDLGDFDSDGSIAGDDDDRYLGEGPEVFASGTNVHELYLISRDKKTRSFFRWKMKKDPYAPASEVCDSTSSGGCRGTIEFLKLSGRDWGMNHQNKSTFYDGTIDTWLIHEDFSSTDVIAGSGSTNYWLDFFPDSLNVVDFKVFLYPHKNPDFSWNESDPSINIAPYVRISIGILPSWKSRGKIAIPPKPHYFSTTIVLEDFF